MDHMELGWLRDFGMAGGTIAALFLMLRFAKVALDQWMETLKAIDAKCHAHGELVVSALATSTEVIRENSLAFGQLKSTNEETNKILRKIASNGPSR